MKLDATFLMENAAPYPQTHSEVRVGAFQRRSLVAGPGARAVVWVTGCNRRCPGCIKPEFLTVEAGTFYAVDYLEEMILNCPSIEGVTYSGGEPFEQATALGELSQRLKRRGLTVLSYSGYRLESLQADSDRFGPLINQLDWLIDGEYIAREVGPFRYLGSANQRMYRRLPDGTFLPETTEQLQEMQLSVTGDGLRIAGFPDRESHRRFEAALQRRGIVLSETHEQRKP